MGDHVRASAHAEGVLSSPEGCAQGAVACRPLCGRDRRRRSDCVAPM